MRRTIVAYVAFLAGLIIIYLFATYTLPPDASTLTKYSLTASQARALSLTVALPLIIIWLVALLGLLRVSQYADRIKKDKDGRSFQTLSQGLAILVFGLPLQSVISTLFSHLYRSDASFIPTGVIIQNYLTLTLFLAGFYFVHKGAQSLVNNIKTPPFSSVHYRVWQGIFAIFSVLFAYLTLANPARQTPTGDVTRAVYYLPDWLITTTIIIPYIFAWYFGMQSAYYLRAYLSITPGILYKKALGFIANGLAAVILASMLIRLLTTMTVYLSDAGLKSLLLIIYLLLLAISVGYILIAIGASKLKKIEDV